MSKRAREKNKDMDRSHCLVPYIVFNDTVYVLLGCRQRGFQSAECETGTGTGTGKDAKEITDTTEMKGWDFAASDTDSHALPSTTARNGGAVTPLEAAARAGYAAFTGVLGSVSDLQSALTTDARVRVPDKGFAYLLRVRSEHQRIATQFTTVARYITSVCGKDSDGSLLHAPHALLAFSQAQWVDVADLRARVAFSGTSAAARAAFSSSRFRHALTSRATDVLRAVLPALEACATLISVPLSVSPSVPSSVSSVSSVPLKQELGPKAESVEYCT
jgi:hypothetical protein